MRLQTSPCHPPYGRLLLDSIKCLCLLRFRQSDVLTNRWKHLTHWSCRLLGCAKCYMTPHLVTFFSVKLNFSERSLTHHRDISWPFVVKGVTGFLIGHTRGVWRGVELWKRDLCHCFFSRNIIIHGSSSFPKRFKSNNGYGIENYKLQIQQYGPAIPLRSWNSQFRYLPETVCGSNFTIRWFPVETTHPIISWHAMRCSRVVLLFLLQNADYISECKTIRPHIPGWAMIRNQI